MPVGTCATKHVWCVFNNSWCWEEILLNLSRFRFSGCWVPCAQICCFAPVQWEVMKPGCLRQGCQLLAKWSDRKRFSEVMISDNLVLARNSVSNWLNKHISIQKSCAYRKECDIRCLNHGFHKDEELCFQLTVCEVWPTHFYWKSKFPMENSKNKTNGTIVHILHLKMWLRICFEFLTTCFRFWALVI